MRKKARKKGVQTTLHAQLTSNQVEWVESLAKDHRTTKSWIVRSALAHAKSLPNHDWLLTTQD